ncbi:ubiquitin-specific protease doa4 [Tulasnella sp. 419]|nr:ubiquitin-specific protease doa4 [Tulasnella sp. 419]
MHFALIYIEWFMTILMTSEVFLASSLIPAAALAGIRWSRGQQQTRRFLSPSPHYLPSTVESYSTVVVSVASANDSNGPTNVVLVPVLPIDIEPSDASSHWTAEVPSQPARSDAGIRSTKSCPISILSIVTCPGDYHDHSEVQAVLSSDDIRDPPVPSFYATEEEGPKRANPIVRHLLLTLILVVPTLLKSFAQWAIDSQFLLETVLLFYFVLLRAVELVRSVLYRPPPQALARSPVKVSLRRRRADTHGWITLNSFDWTTSWIYKSVDTRFFVFPRSLYLRDYSVISRFLSVPLDSLSITLFVQKTTIPSLKKVIVVSTVSQPPTKKSKAKRHGKKVKGGKQQNSTQGTPLAPVAVIAPLQETPLSRIMDMGYTRELAAAAIAAVPDSCDLQAALEWLLRRESTAASLQSPGFQFYDPMLWEKPSPTPCSATSAPTPHRSDVPVAVTNVGTPMPSGTVQRGLPAKQSNVQKKMAKRAKDVSGPSWTDVRKQIVGFYNPNIKCYQNSVMQCLSAAIPFADLILSETRVPGTPSDAFSKVLRMVRKPTSSVALRLDEFRDSWIPDYASRFNSFRQEDACEFFEAFIRLAQQDLAMPLYPNAKILKCRVDYESAPSDVGAAEAWRLLFEKDNNPVTAMFSGLQRQRMSCGLCNATSTVFHEFFPLRACLPPGARNVKLIDLIKNISVPEPIEWRCPTEGCKGEKRRKKQDSLARLPPILPVQIVRFTPTKNYGDHTKNQAKVTFPLKGLDLTSELPNGKGAAKYPDLDIQTGPYKYDLFGVICHHGNSLAYGHYTSYVWSNGHWYSADDDKVKRVSEEEVAAAQAFVLFYRRVD